MAPAGFAVLEPRHPGKGCRPRQELPTGGGGRGAHLPRGPAFRKPYFAGLGGALGLAGALLTAAAPACSAGGEAFSEPT